MELAARLTDEIVADPPAIRWDECELPEAWPDRGLGGGLRIFWQIVRGLFARKLPAVEVPSDLPGAERIPAYVLQEFHGLPNGNYSKRVTEGYSRWFDRVMLGVMGERRQRIADALKGCRSVIDIGCGPGQVAGKILNAGVDEVWGIDPSPYLLQLAQRSYPSLRLVQGVAEDMPFSAERFDGVAACFLFHELPPARIAAAFAECRRILRPGGLLYIIEPGPEQFYGSLFGMLKRFGWRGLYFRTLARMVHEPFVAAFHKRDKTKLLTEHGFDVITAQNTFPTQEWFARATG
jgi:ubiquinone/menaquinone biosynthesis C-methylase UbiE